MNYFTIDYKIKTKPIGFIYGTRSIKAITCDDAISELLHMLQIDEKQELEAVYKVYRKSLD